MRMNYVEFNKVRSKKEDSNDHDLWALNVLTYNLTRPNPLTCEVYAAFLGGPENMRKTVTRVITTDIVKLRFDRPALNSFCWSQQ